MACPSRSSGVVVRIGEWDGFSDKQGNAGTWYTVRFEDGSTSRVPSPGIRKVDVENFEDA